MRTTEVKQDVDHVAYIRQRLADVPASSLTKIAADAHVSMRTLYNLRDPNIDVNPTYNNVMTLYKLLIADSAAQSKGAGKQ